MLGEAERFPDTARPASGNQQRHAGGMATTEIQKPMKRLDLIAGLIQGASRIGRDHSGGSRGSWRRLDLRKHVYGDDSAELLLEPIQKTRPAAVGFESQPLELVAQGGKALYQPSLDLFLERFPATFMLGHWAFIITGADFIIA